LPQQSYFYEHDIFPLAFCEVQKSNSSNSQQGEEAAVGKLMWVNKDDIWSTDYCLPEFKIVHIKVNIKKEQKLPRYPVESNHCQ
jgi:DNA polymerase, archaea type